MRMVMDGGEPALTRIAARNAADRMRAPAGAIALVVAGLVAAIGSVGSVRSWPSCARPGPCGSCAPQPATLRARHADDPTRLLQETRELQRAHGVSAAGALVPALVQVPVFLGLLHVLTRFNRRG
jgi:YidC/Oxa1 family membrane protein insertase